MIVLVLGAGVLVAFLVALLVALLVLTVAVLGGDQATAQPAGTPSEVAVADIPAQLLPVYQEAAEVTCRMRWAVLAAVGKVETDHGRSRLPGVQSGANSAGARGPMQFLAGTWAAYGVDGDGDGDGPLRHRRRHLGSRQLPVRLGSR